MIEPTEMWHEAVRQQEAAAGQAEAAHRFAITSLYYATMHLAGRAFGFDTGAPNNNHEAFYRFLEKRNERAAHRFQSLRRLRVKSHYHLRANISTQDLTTARHHADAVLKLLSLG